MEGQILLLGGWKFRPPKWGHILRETPERSVLNPEPRRGQAHGK
jgi:hypothetical protein